EPPRFADVAVCPHAILPPAAKRHEVAEDGVKEEAQPGAFASPFGPDAVHAVVPVAAADERQTVGAGGDPLVDGAHTMFEERPVLGGHPRLTVGLDLVWRKKRRLEKRHALVQ